MGATEPVVGMHLPCGLVLTEDLGRGGFARVFKAEGSAGRPPVAVKFPLRPELVQALREEAAVLRRLDGPYFVELLAEHLDDEPPHLVLEHCPGGDLRSLLRSSGSRLDPEGVERMFGAVLECVAEAHAAGVIHGDLKPENFLLDESSDPKLADFGLAASGRDDPALAESLATGAQSLRGTLDYLAPEVRQGGAATARSDVFALGVMLQEMLVGARPAGLFKLPSEAVGAPERFDRLVRGALSSAPGDRYEDARAMLHAWDLETRLGMRTGSGSMPPPSLGASIVSLGVLGVAVGAVVGVGVIGGAAGFLSGVFAGGALGGWLGALVNVILRAVRGAARGLGGRGGPG